MANLSGNLPADSAYVADQYRDASKLDARLRLYRLYEESGKPSFYRWLFDSIEFPSSAKVLEVGCGTGSFWSENAAEVPADLSIVLSDFAPPMLEAARSALHPDRYRFERIDVQAIERFAPRARVLPARCLPDAFDVENGARELQCVFSSLAVRNRRSELRVTSAAHVVDYVRSTLPRDAEWSEQPLCDHIEWLIGLQGTFDITLATGLFIATR